MCKKWNSLEKIDNNGEGGGARAGSAQGTLLM